MASRPGETLGYAVLTRSSDHRLRAASHTSGSTVACEASCIPDAHALHNHTDSPPKKIRTRPHDPRSNHYAAHPPTCTPHTHTPHNPRLNPQAAPPAGTPAHLPPTATSTPAHAPGGVGCLIGRPAPVRVCCALVCGGSAVSWLLHRTRHHISSHRGGAAPQGAAGSEAGFVKVGPPLQSAPPPNASHGLGSRWQQLAGNWAR